jgi:hypothetical protein
MEKENALTKELEVYKKQGANLLMPSTEIAGLSEFHAPVIEKVFLSAKPDDGDVYPHDNTDAGPKKKWRPTKQALMKLSVCAGVIWSPSQSKRIDNGADRNYIAYRAVGGIKKPDGQAVFFSADYDIDFEVMEEELREQYEKKAKALDRKSDRERVEYVEYCVKRDMLQKRKFKLRLCEAGAMNRVLRMLLGIKQAYTTEELSKPFVMARIVFRPDFSDKDVRQQFINASIKNMVGVYGPGAAAEPEKEAAPIDITPIDKEEAGDGNGKEDDTNESLIVDFQNANIDEQVMAIKNLATYKKYDLTDFLKRGKMKSVTEMKDEKRLELFKHLLTLADPQTQEPADDDVPF